MGVARHDKEFKAAGEATLDLDELLGALGPPCIAGSGKRREAIAHCLSGSDGWRDAAASLGGAFATLGGGTRLTDDKES